VSGDVIGVSRTDKQSRYTVFNYVVNSGKIARNDWAFASQGLDDNEAEAFLITTGRDNGRDYGNCRFSV
jgi:hypothetical protein